VSRINLSEWALRHQQMVVFLLLLLGFAGVFAYGKLGQKEDPEFTVKTMVIQAYWPGSSAQQMADQVTDKLEKKLQEVAEIDYMVASADLKAWDERGLDEGANRTERLKAIAAMDAYYTQNKAKNEAAAFVVMAAYNSAKLRKAGKDSRAAEWCKNTIGAFGSVSLVRS